MSRGHARQALAIRVRTVLEPWKLPYKGHADELRTVAVFEQWAPVDNDNDPDAPCVMVRIGKVTQTGDTRSGVVTLVAWTYAADAEDGTATSSEQGYRDAENLIEAIETDLISNPWLDGGRYKLTGPWESDIAADGYPTFASTLTCVVEMPSVECVVRPDGGTLDEAHGAPVEEMI